MSYASKIPSSLGHDHGGYSELRKRQVKNQTDQMNQNVRAQNVEAQNLKHQGIQGHPAEVKRATKPDPQKECSHEGTSIMDKLDGSEETIEMKVAEIKERIKELILEDQLARNTPSPSQPVSQPLPADILVAHRLFFVEEDIRELVQEEKSINVDIADEPGDITLSFRARIKRFNALQKKYWFLQQRWWHYYSCFSADQRRTFDLWRLFPKWYMHHILVKDCAGRKGCCSRGCGCCAAREPSSKRPLGAGHCTFECSCCRKARGFEFPKEQKTLFKKKCREEILGLPEHRIVRVAIWGLVEDHDADVDDDSFDMVQADEPQGGGGSSK